MSAIKNYINIAGSYNKIIEEKDSMLKKISSKKNFRNFIKSHKKNKKKK